MSSFKSIEYAKLDNIIAEHGKEFVIAQVITRIAEGCDPKDIARSFGMSYVYLKKWLECECSDDVSLALRARADMLEYQATEEVGAADPDSVAVARLRSDHYMRLAERFDRKRYGVKETPETGGNGLVLPSFVISFIQAPQVQQPHTERVIIEHETERLIIESE